MSNDPDCRLQILRETVLSEIHSNQPDLLHRRLAMVLVTYQTDKLRAVSRLAEHLDIRKPTVSRSLDHLAELGLACRTFNILERRCVWVQRTGNGTAMVEKLGATMAQAVASLEARAEGKDRAGIE